MKQYVGQFDVTVDDSEGPNIFNAMHHLFDYNSRLFLLDLSTCLQKYSKVEAIGILLHHVDVGAGLDGLVEAYGVSTSYHTMDTYFLVDAGQVLLTDIGNLYYLTGVYLFRRIDRGANGLLLRSIDALE